MSKVPAKPSGSTASLRKVCALTEKLSAKTGVFAFPIPHRVSLGLHLLELLAQNNSIGKRTNPLWHI